MGSSESKRIYSTQSTSDEIESVDAGTNKSISAHKDERKNVCNNSGHCNRGLSQFPGFLKALEKSDALVIACYNVRGQLDHISPNVYKLLGHDPTAKAETLNHPTAPHQGAAYYRQHTNGSVVQFHNIFLSKSDTGEVYTIDQPMSDAMATVAMTLLVNSKGDIASCEGWQTFKQAEDGGIIGKNLQNLCPPSQALCISDAIKTCTGNGKCCFNMFTTIMSGACTRAVTMDFHPCVSGQVVVLVSVVQDSVTDGDNTTPGDSASENSVDVTQTHRQDSTAYILGESSHIKPSHSQACGLQRRLSGMNGEIQYLRDFRDKALLPMLSMDKTGTIVWANDAMLNMMGYADAPDEYIGSNAYKYHCDQDLVHRMGEICLSGKTVKNFKGNVIRRDGAMINVTFNSNAKFDSNGTFLHSRCIIQDVTEQNKLLRDRDELEKKKQIAEVSAKEALTASRTKSDFLAVMSHEIRTPINGVIGAASLLSTTALNDDQLDYVNTISDSADILLSLISNILDISKIESGKFQLDKVSIRFVDLVRKCTDMMKNQAKERGLSLVATIGEELDDPGVWHHGDPTRLNQVMLNFLSNALKFTHAGGVECKLIKLATETPGVLGRTISGNLDESSNKYSRKLSDTPFFEEENGSSVRVPTKSSSAVDVIRLEVTDTGVGIEDCSKLFSDFVQASSSVHKKYGGTGLGLSISKKIIHLMHGEVGMSSTVGEGTTVWAEIPLRRAPAPRKGPTFIPSSLSQRIKPKRSLSRGESSRFIRASSGDDATRCSEIDKSGIRILVVEDNKVNQKVLTRLLSTLGYTHVSVAWNGQEAVEAVQDSWEKFLQDPSVGRFDIVLMDCLMPVMDGWEATAAIRTFEEESMARATALSAESHPTIVLALTANATEEDKQRCADCGMDAFYVKPIARDGLNAMMLHWVSKLFAELSSNPSSLANTPRNV